MATKTSPEERSKPSSVSPAPLVAPARRKAAGTRTWLVISDAGGSHLEEVGKQSIMRRTGLPGRDLRILDPMLSYPSTILGRERAIVVKLEHIKAIITATEVLVQNPKDPAVEAFVKDLESRVSNFYRMPQQEVNKAAWGSHEIRTPGSTSPPSIDALQNRTNSPERCVMMINEIKEGHFTPIPEVSKAVGPNILPFEFRVLEICLEAACRCLEFETAALEKEAYPALDELTSKISTLNLERVRQIKSRLVAISGRVQKVRDELEHLLDDDMDMAEMHLTEKIVDEEFEETSAKDENDDDAFESNQERYEEYKSKSKSISESLGSLKPNIEELEMLLEAYFVQIEGTLNKLSTMREYVDDTEDYINIMLDDKQNQLLQMGVMLSTATLVISAGIVVVGFFGMNIHIELFDSAPIKFWETTFGTIGGCLVLYLIALMWGKTTGILG